MMRVDHSQTFMVDYERDVKKYADVLKGIKSPLLLPPAIEKSEVGGAAAWKLTMDMPAAPSNGLKAPQYAQIMKSYFGPGGKMVAWLAPADEHHIVSGFGGKDSVERAIAAIKKGAPGLAGDAGVAKTAAELPAGAMAVAFLSPAGAIDFVGRIVPAFVPPQAKLELKLPEFPQTPPIGFAITTGKDELQTCLVVPGEVLQAIRPYVGKVRAMRGSSTKAGK
jgi:hypothetical protein